MGFTFNKVLSSVRALPWPQWACLPVCSPVNPECLLEPARWGIGTDKMAGIGLLGVWVEEGDGEQTHLPRFQEKLWGQH